jgi:hypothetical protein
MMRPAGSSMPISLTRKRPVTVRNISSALSPLRNRVSPFLYFRGLMNGLSQSIDRSPCVDALAFFTSVSIWRSRMTLIGSERR